MATFVLNHPLISLLFMTTLFSHYPASLASTLTEQDNTTTTHLHFYLHDTLSGSNPSAVRVAGLNPNATSLSFGDIVIFDDPLTKEPDLNSTLVGRGQGYYTHVSKEDLTLMMVVNLVFLEGRFNGSTLSVIGRNSVLNKVREFPIVGGTGAFRGATGWVLDQTYSVDPRTGDGIFEFDVFLV
ncbi:Dirigent protein [Rhynchospora pubera]|uniref:Dirigent protein n=1 Tax=Rhynchospora pubera TaxID=906938 RepID=A0AAV8FVS6_9POAL|nr:Dirigent protein [Rhynchospora pubera]KAJ4796165.1 Dirigent protein [Rhynchospora pubera]